MSQQESSVVLDEIRKGTWYTLNKKYTCEVLFNPSYQYDMSGSNIILDESRRGIDLKKQIGEYVPLRECDEYQICNWCHRENSLPFLISEERIRVDDCYTVRKLKSSFKYKCGKCSKTNELSIGGTEEEFLKLKDFREWCITKGFNDIETKIVEFIDNKQ